MPKAAYDCYVVSNAQLMVSNSLSEFHLATSFPVLLTRVSMECLRSFRKARLIPKHAAIDFKLLERNVAVRDNDPTMPGALLFVEMETVTPGAWFTMIYFSL